MSSWIELPIGIKLDVLKVVPSCVNGINVFKTYEVSVRLSDVIAMMYAGWYNSTKDQGIVNSTVCGWYLAVRCDVNSQRARPLCINFKCVYVCLYKHI